MTELTTKELSLISDALNMEALICKKARAYSKTVTDMDLAATLERIATQHFERFGALLALIGGEK